MFYVRKFWDRIELGSSSSLVINKCNYYQKIMNNCCLKNPDHEWDTQWFLLGGGIIESIQYDTFSSFREKLEQLVVVLTSKYKKSVEEKETVGETLEKVVLMVKGCHYYLHHRKRLDYKEDLIEIQWVKNPYRCLMQYRSKDDQKFNHHLAHFEEPFSKLSPQESQYFPQTFTNFFAEMDLSSWLNLLEDWKSCLEEDETLLEWADNAPLKTYERLLKLHEACIVSYSLVDFSYPPPNLHLIENYLGAENVNGYPSAGPYELIGEVFYENSYIHIRESIIELYRGCSHVPNNMKVKANDLRYTLRWLLKVGWLLLQTDYFPESWLDPNKIDFLRCPVPLEKVRSWIPESLNDKEKKN